MKLKEAVFTVFDFETTGLSPYTGDRICEIGALRFAIDSARPKSFHSLVDPGRPISYGAFRINGITDAMVRGKPAIGEVMPGFLEFIGGSVLVAYNAWFDVGFLEASLGPGAGILEDYYIIDALALARRLFPGIGRYGLGFVAGSLNIDVGPEHRALADAMMTWKVFRKELTILKRSGVETVEDIDRFRMRSSRSLNTVRDLKPRLVDEAIRREKRLNTV
ncbi:MAG: 3'-5' exonuclease [Candidatus Omnitrophota bacterium]